MRTLFCFFILSFQFAQASQCLLTLSPAIHSRLHELAKLRIAYVEADTIGSPTGQRLKLDFDSRFQELSDKLGNQNVLDMLIVEVRNLQEKEQNRLRQTQQERRLEELNLLPKRLSLRNSFSAPMQSAHNLVIFPDYQRVLSETSLGFAQIWNLQTGKKLLELSSKGVRTKSRSNVLTPDSKIIFGISRKGQIRAFDAETGKEIPDYLHFDRKVHDLKITRDGKTLIAAEGKSTLNLIPLDLTQNPISYRFGDFKISHLDLSPDGKRGTAFAQKATSTIQQQFVFDVATGEILKWLPRFDLVANSAFSSNGSSLFGEKWLTSGIIEKIDIATGATTEFFRTTRGSIYNLAVSPKGNNLIVASDDGTIYNIDVMTGQLIETLHSLQSRGSSLSKMGFLPDGNKLLLSYRDESFDVWELQAPLDLETDL